MLEAYPDPATGGAPWTCGWGCTGPSIGPGVVWTQEQADAELEHRLQALEDVLRAIVKVPTTSNEWAALCSLAWNIGTDGFAHSTVLRKLNEGDVVGAGNAFLLWNRAAGKVNADLVKRRIQERAIFLGEANETA